MKESPEDVSTPGEETDDDNSPADIKDPEDYREIFQPKHRLPRDSECKPRELLLDTHVLISMVLV